MFYQERQKKILEYIETKPSVSVTELSREFQVSAVTIRKDLNELSDEGKIERTHGGAISLNKSGYEQVEEEKENINNEFFKMIDELVAKKDAMITSMNTAKEVNAISNICNIIDAEI